jgi:oligopeptide transport system substrate-binding protein
MPSEDPREIRDALAIEWSRRRFLHRSILALGAAGLGNGLLAACSSGKSSSTTTTASGTATTAGSVTSASTAPSVSTTATGKKVVIRVPMEEPGFAAPGNQPDLGSSFLGHLCFSGLWVMNDKRVVVPSDVATYTPSADLKTHTLKLKNGLKWSDGTPYDATTYEWSLQFMAKTYNALADRWLKGAPEIIDGKTKDYTTIGWKADPSDPNTLVVHTNDSVNFFPIWAGGRPYQFVQPKHNIEKYGPKNYAQLPHLAANGPYMVAEWKHNASLKLVRNPNYQGQPVAIPDEIDVTIFTSALDVDAFNAFLGDQLDVAVTPIANVATVNGSPVLKNNSSQQTYADVTFILLNTTKKPFDDVRVRQALYMAIDRDTLVKDVLQGRGDPAWGVLSPSMKAGYDPSARPFPDLSVAKAKQLLSDAGYPGGKGFPTIKYLAYNVGDQALVAQYVQNQWKTNLGVEMQIQNLDPGSWFSAVIGVDPGADWGDAADAFWPSDYPEPSEIVGQLFDRGGAAVYHHHWQKPPDLEKLQNDALFEKDASLRSKMLNEYDMRVAAQAPLIPLLFPRQIQVHKPGFTGGYYFYGTDFYQLRYMNKQ